MLEYFLVLLLLCQRFSCFNQLLSSLHSHLSLSFFLKKHTHPSSPLPPEFELVQVVGQVVPLHLDARPLIGQDLHLPPQLAHLLLVQVGDARRLAAAQPLHLHRQRLVLLLQEADLLDVAGEAVVQVLQLRLLVGPRGQELLVEGVRQAEVQGLAHAGVGAGDGGPRRRQRPAVVAGGDPVGRRRPGPGHLVDPGGSVGPAAAAAVAQQRAVEGGRGVGAVAEGAAVGGGGLSGGAVGGHVGGHGEPGEGCSREEH